MINHPNRSKRRAASLDAAIDWIAQNDETAETNVEAMAELISVLMVADLWSREPEQIARKVLARRRELERPTLADMPDAAWWNE